jgi:hypothetical protein
VKNVALLVLFAALTASAPATWLNDPDRSYELRASTELGFVGIPAHTIQFGVNGTRFDYVKDGGQNLLFPYRRLAAELHLKPRHSIVFLYQPIDIRTEQTLFAPLVVDTDTFATGTPMNFRYGFDFYRLSYQYDIFPEPERELAFGLSLQIRDAAISFASQDGRQLRAYNDLGPVPILRLRGRFPLTESTWLGTEIDGFYAQGTVVTGSTNVESSFKGAILDASLRYGMTLSEWLDGFLNVRYLGGGAEGQQNTPENPGADGYTSNWLGTVSVSLGFQVR